VPNPDQADSDGVVIGDLCCCVLGGDVDYDGTGQIAISDLVYLVDYMFNGGAAPPDFTS